MTEAERDSLKRAIAASVEVHIATHEDGSRTVRGLDDKTAEKITAAVVAWLEQWSR